jgi:hypothetical protein
MVLRRLSLSGLGKMSAGGLLLLLLAGLVMIMPGTAMAA